MKEKYYVLTDNMKLIMEAVSPSEQYYIAQGIEQYITEYREIKEKYTPQTAAYNFALEIDKFIEETKPPRGRTVSCKKGCSYCCYMNVDITTEEAILILSYCKEKNIPIDWETLEKQKLLDVDTHVKAPKNIRRCIFLDKKENCKIYEHRPISCRKMYSLDNPQDCDSSKAIKKIARFVSPKAEIIACGVINATEFGSMASTLLKLKFFYENINGTEG